MVAKIAANFAAVALFAQAEGARLLELRLSLQSKSEARSLTDDHNPRR
jgi:hypothetical protein